MGDDGFPGVAGPSRSNQQTATVPVLRDVSVVVTDLRLVSS
jgi:hypothetical protein